MKEEKIMHAAVHPQEKLMWEQAKLAYEFWVYNR